MPLGPVSASLLFYHAHSILQEISSFYCFAKSRQSKMGTLSLLSWFIGHGEINQSRILLFLKRPSQRAFFFQIIVARNRKMNPPQKTAAIIGQFSLKWKYQQHFDPTGVIFYILCGMSRDLTPTAKIVWLIRRVI
jgi:hypothetical protein